MCWKCAETASSRTEEEEEEGRVSVARQVFAVDLGVLECPRMLCVTMATGVSVTETSRVGSAQHGQTQLHSRSSLLTDASFIISLSHSLVV